MSRAIFLAHRCSETGDVPVGALVLDENGKVIGEGRNRREADGDPTAHAEILALREAGQNRGTWNLAGCTLVVTLEPCTMCAGAAVAARVDRVVFGAWDEKAGACGSVRDVVRDPRMNHQIEVIGGVAEQDASIQLQGFFAAKRMAAEHKHSAFWQQGSAPDPAELAAQAPAADPPPSEPTVPAPTAAGLTSSGPTVSGTSRRRSDRHRGRIPIPPLEAE